MYQLAQPNQMLEESQVHSHPNFSIFADQKDENHNANTQSPSSDPNLLNVKTSKKNRKKSQKLLDDPNIKIKIQEEKRSNFHTGHWSFEENKKYHWFLEIHNSHFLQKHLRRMDKIFKAMSIFVGSREAEQCRSHHQKMQKKYDHSFSRILLNLRRQHYTLEDGSLIEEDLRLNDIKMVERIIQSEVLHARTLDWKNEEEKQHTQVQENTIQPKQLIDFQLEIQVKEIEVVQARDVEVEERDVEVEEASELNINALLADDFQPYFF